MAKRQRRGGGSGNHGWHSHVANPYTADPYQIDVICAGTLTEIDPSKNQFFIIELQDLDGNFRLQLENYEYDRLGTRPPEGASEASLVKLPTHN
jgi:hypothetical protein